MHVETKFLWLFRAVELGDDVDGWQVCWLGGWDRCRVLFVVMVKRVTPDTEPRPQSHQQKQSFTVLPKMFSVSKHFAWLLVGTEP